MSDKHPRDDKEKKERDKERDKWRIPEGEFPSPPDGLGYGRGAVDENEEAGVDPDEPWDRG